jgi:hypothetical protein
VLTAIIADQHGKHRLPLDIHYDLAELQQHLNRTLDCQTPIRLVMRDAEVPPYENTWDQVALLTIVGDGWLALYRARRR